MTELTPYRTNAAEISFSFFTFTEVVSGFLVTF